MKKPSISACLIVQNEEKHIKKCIESLLFTDEIIIYDTGSTDNTKNIIKEFDIKLIEGKWKDSFAQACQRSFKNEPFLVVRIEPH